ncbi:MAG TPA: hypothetical protein VK550_26195 [Polyangiaceae bacterium]|nr:hypothetical protein [Polyangiaceae bacterium]
MNAPAPHSSDDQKTDVPAVPSQVQDADRAVRRTLSTGWWLLAVSLPLGVTLEALHGFKVDAYLGSEARRELWRLAHAHGTLLGILCLVFAALAERHVAPSVRRGVARQLAWGAVLMPLGFFFGGILNSEGDPSLGIVLVPVGAGFLFVALARAARNESS